METHLRPRPAGEDDAVGHVSVGRRQQPRSCCASAPAPAERSAAVLGGVWSWPNACALAKRRVCAAFAGARRLTTLNPRIRVSAKPKSAGSAMPPAGRAQSAATLVVISRECHIFVYAVIFCGSGSRRASDDFGDWEVPAAVNLRGGLPPAKLFVFDKAPSSLTASPSFACGPGRSASVANRVQHFSLRKTVAWRRDRRFTADEVAGAKRETPRAAPTTRTTRPP